MYGIWSLLILSAHPFINHTFNHTINTEIIHKINPACSPLYICIALFICLSLFFILFVNADNLELRETDLLPRPHHRPLHFFHLPCVIYLSQHSLTSPSSSYAIFSCVLYCLDLCLLICTIKSVINHQPLFMMEFYFICIYHARNVLISDYIKKINNSIINLRKKTFTVLWFIAIICKQKNEKEQNEMKNFVLLFNFYK